MRVIYLRRNLQQIKFDNVFSAQNATGKVCVSYLDVRNQVANSRLKSRDFKIQITVLVMCQKIENSKEATNQKKQARKKV